MLNLMNDHHANSKAKAKRLATPRVPDPIREGGFSLVEMGVVLGILVALTVIYMYTFNPDKSNGKVLFTTMTKVGSALVAMKQDTSCYPATTNALFVRTAAANSQCGIDLTSQWQGPYYPSASTDAAGNITLPKVSPAVTLTIGQGNNLNGTGNTVQWFVQANNVPNEVIRFAVDACNGSNTNNGKCIGNPGGGAAGTGTFRYIFDEHV